MYVQGNSLLSITLQQKLKHKTLNDENDIPAENNLTHTCKLKIETYL